MRQAMLQLEIFETAATDEPNAIFDARQVEKLRETAFEQGYAAGWQDALEQMRHEDALRRIASEEALQAISFSYHEAQSALQPAFAALAQAMLETVMPEAARMALPAFLDSELREIAARHTQCPVRLRCASSASATLAQIASSVPSLKIELVAEPSFTDAQITLSIGAQERDIDLDDVLVRLREIFAQSLQCHNHKGTAHG